MDQQYTEYVVGQYAARQQGNVGVVAMTSRGDYAAAAATSASIQVSRTTMFEVGSTTKTFATLALELLAGQGKLSMTDTLGTHLGGEVTLSPLVASITLNELATHTSGLERMPTNIDPQNPDPMHAYRDTDMYEYLSGLTRSCTSAQDTNCVGPKKFLYSNTGFGLIGWITCLVSGQGWEALIKDLILTPLGMSDTAVALSSDQQRRLAPPYARGQPSGPTTFTDVMVGAGGLRSTPVDMLQYTKAFAGLVTVSADMRAAMDRMLRPYASDEFPNLRGQANEAFQQYTLRKETAHWKDGATSGYNCYMAFLPGKSAAIVLANTAADSADTATALAANLILAGPTPQHTPVFVPFDVMQSYAGQYTQAPDPYGGPQAQNVHYTVQANPQYPALLISSDANPTVEVRPFQQDAFFAQGVESYMQAGTLIMLYSGQDHYASRGYTSPDSNASTSYPDWLHSRSLTIEHKQIVIV
jgi:CubicO group peptidase (beta-lactamase class C family)